MGIHNQPPVLSDLLSTTKRGFYNIDALKIAIYDSAFHTDILILGAGLSGMRAAMAVLDREHYAFLTRRFALSLVAHF